MPLYREALRHLEETGAVFACSCSRSKLAATSADGAYPGTCLMRNIPLDTPGVSWRLKTAADDRIMVHDLVKGRTEFPLPASMRHVVVRKKDGDPSYQLASVIDDIQYGVDLVVRGDDLFESTLAQVFLSRHLPANAFSDTVFFHHPLLQDPKGRKLSKSEGDTAARYFRERGGSPRAIFAAVSAALSMPGAASTWEELFVQLLDRWQIKPA
jgi:glutamyl-tRNA synthetase